MSNSVEFLLVEDRPDDSKLFQLVMQEAEPRARLHLVQNCEEARTYLEKRENSQSPPLVIILDLNLPGKNGLVFLREIKESNHWKHLPIVVLTSSQAPKDIREAYEAHANSYICKPLELAQFREVLRLLFRYWSEVVRHSK